MSRSPRERLAAAGHSDPELVWASFMETIFGEARGLIDLRFIDDRRTIREEHSKIETAVSAIACHLHENVYVGVAKRRLPKTQFDVEEAKREPSPNWRRKPGGKFNLAECSAFWVDWDPADHYVDDDDATGHREEFLIALEQHPKGEPSMIVWSGSGFHAYWLFEEPEDLSTREAVVAFESVTGGMARHYKTDSSTKDASRILRLPGTINWPSEAKRRKGRLVEPCVIYRSDEGRRF